MIRKVLYTTKSKDKEAQSLQQNLVNQKDFDAVWEIFHKVVKTGDTYTFHPDSPKQNLGSYWFAEYMHTYVYQTEEGKIIGTYIIKPNQIGLGSHIANASFMVHPDYQGKGIGKAMCQHCLETAKKLGFKAMQFNIVVSTNLPAVALWKKFGFEIIGTIPQAFHNLKIDKYVDAFIMYRKL